VRNTGTHHTPTRPTSPPQHSHPTTPTCSRATKTACCISGIWSRYILSLLLSLSFFVSIFHSFIKLPQFASFSLSFFLSLDSRTPSLSLSLLSIYPSFIGLTQAIVILHQQARVVSAFKAHERLVTCVDASPVGDVVVTSGFDGAVHVWGIVNT
jgi:WD40 repeat protein